MVIEILIAGMNRLAPLIVRRPRTVAVAAPYRAQSGAPAVSLAAPVLSDDLRLFATSFLAGLAFFGAYLA